MPPKRCRQDNTVSSVSLDRGDVNPAMLSLKKSQLPVSGRDLSQLVEVLRALQTTLQLGGNPTSSMPVGERANIAERCFPVRRFDMSGGC